MSPLNTTGLRLAAAGAAAALTLAVGAPAFAQGETPTVDDASTPAADDASTPVTDDQSSPADDSTPEGDDTSTPAGDDASDDAEDGAADDLEEGAEEAAEEEYYEFAFLDNWIEDVSVGETVTAAPQIQVEGSSSIDRAGTLVWFTDTVDMDAWFEDEWTDFSEVATGHATVVDQYDNCSKEIPGFLACVVTDWNPEEGKTYAPSADSPVNYLVEGQVDEQDISAYSAFDLTAEDVEDFTTILEIDLEGPNAFSLSEVPASDVGDEDYFFYGEAWILFVAAIEDIPHPNVPGEDDPSLPSTGNSSIVLISSAAGALLAGAVVFYLLRRRKTAANWE
jgi:LPXTG-motif cell wall-anchored protein